MEFDSSRAAVSDLYAAVKNAGYAPRVSSVELSIQGMSCASCVGRVERAIRTVPGIVSATLNLATARARVELLGERDALGKVLAAVAGAGYTAQLIDDTADTADSEGEAREREVRAFRSDLYFAAAFTVPLFLIAIAQDFHLPIVGPALQDLLPARDWWWVEFALAAPMEFWAGRRFLRSGWTELWHLSPGMNSLVMLGSGAAFLYSTLALLMPRIFPAGSVNVYFEAAGVIVTLILLGHFMEAVAKGRTSEAIKKLMRLRAKSALVVRDGREIELPIEQVVVGDVVQVRPREGVALDGKVTEGQSFVDESMISGEPVPVEKQPGADVVGGTINKTGSFRFAATRVGKDTLLSQIIKTVEEAQSSKPQIQRLADQVAMAFVPAVMAVAALTFVVWLAVGPAPALSLAFVTGVSVLLIACPCAMGLGTPTAIMVATGKGAEMGVLIRRGTALEALAGIDIVVLDVTLGDDRCLPTSSASGTRKWMMRICSR